MHVFVSVIVSNGDEWKQNVKIAAYLFAPFLAASLILIPWLLQPQEVQQKEINFYMQINIFLICREYGCDIRMHNCTNLDFSTCLLCQELQKISYISTKTLEISHEICTIYCCCWLCFICCCFQFCEFVAFILFHINIVWKVAYICICCTLRSVTNKEFIFLFFFLFI